MFTSLEITEMYNMKTVDIFVHMFHSIIGFLLCLQERKCVPIRAAIFCVYLQSYRPIWFFSSASSAPPVLIYSCCIQEIILLRKNFFTTYMSSLEVWSSKNPIQEDTGVIHMYGIIVICAFHLVFCGNLLLGVVAVNRGGDLVLRVLQSFENKIFYSHSW